MIFDEAKVGVYITNLLNTNIGNNIFPDRAPQNQVFPYAVLKILDPFQQEGSKTRFMMEINVWDNKNKNKTDLLELTKRIAKFLHKRMCGNEDLSLFFMLESSNPIPNLPEDQLRRRELRFAVDYYNKNV